MSKKILIWFRNDLRLHDNEMLVEALSKSDAVLPVYILDPRYFGTTSYNTNKTGSLRAKFLLDSVLSLRNSLKQIGGNLLVVSGKPEDLIPSLVAEHEISEVYHHREVASEETFMSSLVENELWKLKINLKHFIGHTLHNKEDLPFPIKDIPDVFNQFKKKVDRESKVNQIFDAPDRINVVDIIDWGVIPSLNDLGLEDVIQDSRAWVEFKGGEVEAKNHLNYVVNTITQAGNSKNVVLKSGLSAWLSLGCLSPRQVYWAIKKIENLPNTKAMYNQVLMGLLWRDYFRFMFKKYGNIFFKPNGFSDTVVTVDKDDPNFEKWKRGQTGFAIVDAIMNELNQTGYISIIARQITAHYLIFNLEVSWVLGAAYFEERLIDYNPSSNWGNWATMAGVGNDQKTKKLVDIDKNMKNIDPKGDYSNVWNA